MSVSMNSVFSGGWKNIKENPIMFVPMALDYLIALVTLFFIRRFFIQLFSVDLDLLLLDYTELEAFLMGLTPEVIFPFILIVSVLLLISTLFSFYLQAGLIGMSYDAAKTGETKLSSLLSYGNKYFLRIVLASILRTFIVLLPLVIIYAILLVSLMLLATSLSGVALILILLTLLLFLLYLPYLIVVIIYTYFILHAIVIDDTPVIESFRKSKALFNKNKSDFIVFIVVIIAAYIVASIISMVFSLLTFLPVVGLVISYIVGFFIDFILSTFIIVWGTRMYLELTGNGCCYGCLDGENEAGWSNETYDKQNTEF